MQTLSSAEVLCRGIMAAVRRSGIFSLAGPRKARSQVIGIFFAVLVATSFAQETVRRRRNRKHPPRTPSFRLTGCTVRTFQRMPL